MGNLNKVLSITILNKLETYGLNIIGECHCGFIKGKSTTDHIFKCRHIIEKYYEYNKDLHSLFVYYKQAYDSININ